MATIRRGAPAVLLLLLSGQLHAEDACLAQPTRLGLTAIANGAYKKPGDQGKSPAKMYADTRGGYAEFLVRHTRKFSEQLRVEWEFDRDVRDLRAGEKLGVRVRFRFLKEGPKSQDPYQANYGHRAQQYWVSVVNLYNSTSMLRSEKKLEVKPWRGANFSGRLKDVYARSSSKNATVGAHAGSLTVAKALNKGYTGFAIRLNATAFGNSKDPRNPRSCHFEWVYLYRSDAPGRRVVVSLGNAKPPARRRSSPAKKDRGTKKD